MEREWEGNYWSLYIQCMLLINSDKEYMIYIVQTIDSWGVLHMSSIYYTWYILFILSIHDVCYICHQSLIHVIECWCLFNVIVINNPPPSPHNIHQQLTSVLHSGVSMLMNACGKYRCWFRNIPSLYQPHVPSCLVDDMSIMLFPISKHCHLC